MAQPRGPRGRNNMPTEKIEHPIKMLVTILKFIGESYLPHLLIVLVCIILGVLANVRGTWFTKSLIDKFIPEIIKNGGTDYKSLYDAITRVAIFYCIGILCIFIQNETMVFVTQGTLKKLRDKMFNHMQSLPIKYFDTHSYGEIMSMYTNDIDTLRQMIAMAMPQMVNSIITIVSVFVSMLMLSLPLAVITTFMVVFVLYITKLLTSKSGKNFIKQQKHLASVNGYIEEMMTGQKVVKVFCHEQKMIDDFVNINDELCQSAYKANKFSNVMAPINAQLGNLSYVICACLGAIIAINHLPHIVFSPSISTGIIAFKTLTAGSLVSFLTYNKQFSQPINQMSMQANSIIMALAGADRIFKLLDEKPEVDDGYVSLVNCTEENGKIVETTKRTGHWAWKHYHKESDTTDYIPLKGEIILDDVDFGYTDEKIVLHNVEMYAKPGEKIAFVGSTGAGKTTITNLINRFYDIQDGKIRYDGININKIKKADLRKSLGMVLQDTHLFTGTIKDNIRFGRLDATDEEVYSAAKLANADKFIKRLPKGYDTMITKDGGNLSQGQRQLLAIARAAVADPPVLILDEATSSIDTRTERIVQEGMDALMKGRTTFVIAHRLSTIKNSDCIMVLDQGRIMERGNHDELMNQQGIYYKLQTGAVK